MWSANYAWNNVQKTRRTDKAIWRSTLNEKALGKLLCFMPGELRHLCLFSGIGGFTIAAQWAGFRTVGFAEIEPYCCRLLEQRWPGIKNYGSVDNTEPFRELRGRITVLSAGVPCQPASLAGKRKGKDDARWKWPATLAIVGSVKPAWCIFENPPGIAMLSEFEEVLLCLANLGYEIAGFNVPSESVGADFLGYRTFIIAAPKRIQRSSWNVSGSQQTQKWRASSQSRGCPGWESEPTVPRVANGFPQGKHYLSGLGNAAVPQQAYPFFQAIAQVETCVSNFHISESS